MTATFPVSSAGDRINAAALLDPAEGAAAVPRIRTASELLSDTTLQHLPDELVPFLVRKGCVTLLAGPPKTGKSTFLANALVARTEQSLFLGKPVSPVGWLWIGLDEPEPILVDRLSRLQLREDVKSVHFLIRRDLSGRSVSAALLSRVLKQTGAEVVIVDTLGRLAAQRGVDITNGDDVLPFLSEYVDVIRGAGAGLLLSSHTRKDRTTYKGAVELEAEVDAPLMFSVDESKAGARRLSGTTRWGDVKVSLVSVDGLRYDIDTSTGRNDPSVLSALSPISPVATDAVAKMVGRRKAVVASELQGLLAVGRVSRSAAGWVLSTSPPTEPSPS